MSFWEILKAAGIPALLLGVVITCMATARKSEKNQAIALAVTDTKIQELTREVRSHNHFAQRLPVVECQISTIHHRLDTLEQERK